MLDLKQAVAFNAHCTRKAAAAMNPNPLTVAERTRLASLAARLLTPGMAIRIDPEQIRPDEDVAWRGTVQSLDDDANLVISHTSGNWDGAPVVPGALAYDGQPQSSDRFVRA